MSHNSKNSKSSKHVKESNNLLNYFTKSTSQSIQVQPTNQPINQQQQNNKDDDDIDGSENSNSENVKPVHRFNINRNKELQQNVNPVKQINSEQSNENLNNGTKKLDIIDRNVNIFRSIIHRPPLANINVADISQKIQTEFTIDHNLLTSTTCKKRELETNNNNQKEKKTRIIEQKRKLTKQEIESICDSFEVFGNGDFEHMVELMNNVRQDVRSQLEEIEIYPSLISKLKQQIKHEYYASQIDAGQMVGVDSATSLGEPTTQMSVHKDEKIKVLMIPKQASENKHKFFHGTISEFCDNVIEQVQTMGTKMEKFIQKENNDKSVVVDLSCFNKDFYIVGVDQNELCNWQKISHVSKHPVNGEMMKVRTRCGRTVCTTLSHSHLKRKKDGGVEPIEGRLLQVGDRIPVLQRIVPSFEFQSIETSTYTSWINDMFKDDFDLEKFEIPTDVFMFSKYFKVVFIQKLIQHFPIYFVDTKNYKVQIGNTNNLQLLFDLQFIFNHLNIIGCIETTHSHDIPNNHEFEETKKLVTNIKMYTKCVPEYCFVMYGMNYNRFVKFLYNCGDWKHIQESLDSYPHFWADMIPHLNENLWSLYSDVKALAAYKDRYYFLPSLGEEVTRSHAQIKLQSLKPTIESLPNCQLKLKLQQQYKICEQAVNGSVVWDKILHIEIYTPEDENEFVYDFTVPGNETFMVDSGIIVHNTLNTFHTSGISCAAVTTGVPRFRELLDASKQQKHSLITFELKEQPKNIQEAKVVARSFDEKRVFSLLKKQIPNVQEQRHLNISREDKLWYSFFEKYQHHKFESLKWSLRFQFDKSQLFEYRLTLKQIASTIQQNVRNCYCVYSPDFVGIIDVYVDCSNISVEDVVNYRKQNDGIKQKQDKMRKYTFITPENKDFYFLRDILFQYIGHLKVSGVYCIEKSHFRQRIPDKKWIFELEGTNFREIINHQSIDFKSCYINNIWEIYSSLGIEAVRSFLVSEFNNIIVSGGMNVDRVHLELLADSMTCTGNITSVSRYGIGRNETGPLTKASFEQSLDNMLIAAYRSETETIQSVSSSVILGQCSRIGSGMMELFTKLSLSVDPQNEVEEYNPEDPQMLYKTKTIQTSNNKVIQEDVF